VNRQLTASTRLESIRKEAKRWLKALRSGDATAQERLRRAYGSAPAQPSLRHIQHALAREYGEQNWDSLRVAVGNSALTCQSHDARLAQFLEHACLRYGIRPNTRDWDQRYYDHPSSWIYAARILERHADVVTGNIHAAAVGGDLAEVKRIIKARAAAANEHAALDGRRPLEYVCYGRLPTAATTENAVAIADLLLNAGAACQYPQPDDDGAHFQPLTAAIGGGENNQPPHAQAERLATMLIEHGADPYDAQALYNTSLGGDDFRWLDLLFDQSAKRSETHKWTRPSSRWPKCPMVDFLLIMAVHRNHVNRAQWALAHGADPRCRHAYYAPRNLHTDAIVNGYAQMADLLIQCGGVADILDPQQAFQVACLRVDRHTAEQLLRQHPEVLLNPAPLMLAASRDLLAVAELLLDLGMSPNIEDHSNFRPLHAAASHDSIHVGRLLLERGADIDPLETRFNSTPLGWAMHGGKRQMMDMLGAMSRSPKALVWMGHAARLRQLLAEDPRLAKSIDDDGSLFHTLPEDEDCAVEIAELLLAHGADARVKGKNGTTAIEYARNQGHETLADLLTRATRLR
jgi:uncharacterized protein